MKNPIFLNDLNRLIVAENRPSIKITEYKAADSKSFKGKNELFNL